MKPKRVLWFVGCSNPKCKDRGYTGSESIYCKWCGTEYPWHLDKYYNGCSWVKLT